MMGICSEDEGVTGVGRDMVGTGGNAKHLEGHHPGMAVQGSEEALM
jgi:hypothetical protein